MIAMAWTGLSATVLPAKASHDHLGNATRCAPLHNVHDLPVVGQAPKNFRDSKTEPSDDLMEKKLGKPSLLWKEPGCGAFSTGSGMCSRILPEPHCKTRRRYSGGGFAAAFFACSARMAASSASTFFRSSSVSTAAVRGGGMSWTAG
jgi:hypothetical protein